MVRTSKNRTNHQTLPHGNYIPAIGKDDFDDEVIEVDTWIFCSLNLCDDGLAMLGIETLQTVGN